ncbi:hypothetical protein IDH20_02220 [Pelagibacterales bacterium SAG-MED39]|nr:hypothetical protein [Pelagibacterales bacterium SAG-MED39]
MIPKKLIIIGGNRFNELNPFQSIIKVLKNYEIKYEIITSNIHLNKLVKNNLTFKKYLKKKKISYKKINDYSTLFGYLKKLVKIENCRILLVHSAFILKNNIINLMKSDIFNYHVGSLPEQRGAAPGTFQILMSKKSTNMTIHRVIGKLDAGNIVLTKKILLQKNHNLLDFYKKVEKNEYNFFKKFFTNNFKTFKERKQNSHSSVYMPRLDSKIHGYINWSWEAKDIYDFVRAFDKPFPGARTFLNGKEVIIKNLKLVKKKLNFHPFQNGIIFKKDKNYYYIASKNYCLRTNDIRLINGRKIESKILGKRLYTPYSILDKSFKTVSIHSPEKLKSTEF